MSEVLTLGVKGVLGGLFVVAFAALSETLRPKSFAGLLGAAPSIALASLLVIDVTKSSRIARQGSIGMICGALALVAYCVSATLAVDRWGALRGSVVAFAAWFATAGAIGALFWAR